MKKAVFLDRDGTLIEEVNFLHRVEDLRFFDYTDQAISLLKENGYLVVIVTNQSGVGRGIYSESDMNSIHRAIQDRLTHKIDAFYHCPHLPDSGCRCRKPSPGMIEAACQDFDIDLKNSWVVGDKALDVELGSNVNINTALVLTGYGATHRDQINAKPDFVAENLIEAVNHILSKNN
jgi:D-glycero-D-manno-heptose 1,7-bisphosphate phosphatase